MPSVEHAYLVHDNGLNAILTKTLNADGTGQDTSAVFYDGLLRAFQSQSPGLDAGADHDATAAERGQVVTHTYYNSAGRVTKTTGPWWAEGAPSTTPVVPVAVPPSLTTYTYDSAGRKTAEIFWVGNESEPGNEKWRTETFYDGDTTLTVPPVGATPESTVVDARGRVVERTQYVRDPREDAVADTLAEVLALTHQSTEYGYDAAGRLTTLSDAEDNIWSYSYDWGGRQVTAGDPDGGLTTKTYDALDRVATQTNANGQVLAYTFDSVGRATALRDGSTTGAVRASWTYDTALDPAGDRVLGQLAQSNRYLDGNIYSTEVKRYDDAYRPLETSFTLPDIAEFDALSSRTFTNKYTYTSGGKLSSTKLPAIVTDSGTKVLGAETVTTRYDAASMPEWMSGGFGWGTYVAESRFAADGRITATDLGNTYGAYATYGYEDGTNRLSAIGLTRQNLGVGLNLVYGYDAAGNITSIKDQPTATAATQDNQCFEYDGLRRLETAWTALNGTCIAGDDVVSASVGGAQPYWTSYSYNSLGNRTSMTEHAVGGSAPVLSTYNVGTGGTTPHQIDSVVRTTAGSSTTTNFDYDDAGNRTERSSGSDTTTYDWDAEGELAADDDYDYVYDASGNRIVRDGAGGTTVYLPGGQELTIDGATVTANRHYSFAGLTVAMRTSNGLGAVTSLVADRDGTVVAAVPNTTWTTSSLARVYSDPFGRTRGSSDAALSGDQRFLGATRDADSGLTLLGARYYDPTVGCFLSVDPVLDVDIPAHLHAYAYGFNNPVTYADPSGTEPKDKNGNYDGNYTNRPTRGIGEIVHDWFKSGVETLLERLAARWVAPTQLGLFGNGFGFDFDGGVYTSRPDAKQLGFGYSDIYDYFFDVGTDMEIGKYQFQYGDDSYVLWTWKGDYVNLGAGAEIGCYFHEGRLEDEPPFWNTVSNSEAPDMSVTLRGPGGQGQASEIASYDPDDPLAWVAVFNSKVQDPTAASLSVDYTVTFPNDGMYQAFRESESAQKGGWVFYKETRTATLKFRRRKKKGQ
ncbi:hypothetical protein BH11ACT5_BH11ACT5_14070 [soil metagenome]